MTLDGLSRVDVLLRNYVSISILSVDVINVFHVFYSAHVFLRF